MLTSLATLAPPSPEAQARVDAATAEHRRAVLLRPNDAQAYAELAVTYQQHRFQRAASEAWAVTVQLAPTDAGAYRQYGVTVKMTGDQEGALRAFRTSLSLRPSDGATYFNYGNALTDQRQRADAFLQAVQLEPTHYGAHSNLVSSLRADRRYEESLTVLRRWARSDPSNGLRRLAYTLIEDERKLEAAHAFHAAAAHPSPPSERTRQAAAWTAWVDEAAQAAPRRPRKCLARECIEGLERHLKEAEGGPRCDAGPAPASPEELRRLTEGRARPRLLRKALEGWRPYEAWDAATLGGGAAGGEELDVTVVERAGSFEVHADRIERPPKSAIRLRDLLRLLALRSDANLTLYTRQAGLWPLPSLVREMAPLPWMERLHVHDLNVWLGDGHFRNTLHFDPYDNFLCQLRGAKHLQLWPPEASPYLYYNQRKDIQAQYEPGRGEYQRRDTGIISDNTAGVNGASPDLAAFPRFAQARPLQSSCHVQPGDCLYLPRGFHHHVFSEADADEGFNAAINIWVHRDGEDVPQSDDRSGNYGAKPDAPPAAKTKLTLAALQEVLSEVLAGGGGVGGAKDEL